VRAALVGDVKKARELNLRLLRCTSACSSRQTDPGQVGARRDGHDRIRPRLPLSPLAEKFHQALREALHEAGIACGLRVVEGRA